jgi:lycopene cyclase domain-containing protein
MTYLFFLVIFVAVPTLLLTALFHGPRYPGGSHRFPAARHWLGTLLLAVIALVWTTPWDNWIIARGVWSYGEARVLGTIGLVPVEEYGFMLLMPLFNASIIAFFIRRHPVQPSQWQESQRSARVLILLVFTCVWLVALACLRFEKAFYLSSTLVWFLPPLALQAVFDPSALRRHRRLILAGALVPTAYLSLVDAYAIHDGIWTIHSATRTGLECFGLPLEEAFFFFITSWLLARGLVLWHSLFAHKDA